MKKVEVYKSKYKIRIITAGSLFDGHDAAINIMRRILQLSGAEIIHLGHNRSVQEVVDAAIQEDVQAIAVTSYQGGHIEYFKYMYDLLKEKNAGYIKIFGGGGGTILPDEIRELHDYGITRIYSPDDGRKMGLQNMINDVLKKCDFVTKIDWNKESKLLIKKKPTAIAKGITLVESHLNEAGNLLKQIQQLKAGNRKEVIPVIGITGTGGAGKSSLLDELIRRFLNEYEDETIAVICIDPSKRKTGGALLGDRIRMNAINNPRVYLRSLATRQSNMAVSKAIRKSVDICKAARFDIIFIETSGIGQSDTEIVEYCDIPLYIMTPEYGASTQLEKINMLDYADLIVINKFDKPGADDALRDVRKQYKRSHNLFNVEDNDLPVFATIASQFNDAGMNNLFVALIDTIAAKTKVKFKASYKATKKVSKKPHIIPASRVRYLSEIVETINDYNKWVEEQSNIAQKMYRVRGAIEILKDKELEKTYNELAGELAPECKKMLDSWPQKRTEYKNESYKYKVRKKIVELPLYYKSLSGTKIPKISLPKYNDWGDILKWQLTENLPGEFPYTAGVYPLKGKGETPTRMFAGEGSPERTNKRYHYISHDQPYKRLSTAFDSVTLYGEDPNKRYDIYGKIGNSGVSVATLDDVKKLYSGFDLVDAHTSVSMTINGPAPIMLAFFMNAAIDQQCEKYIVAHGMKGEVNKKISKIYKNKNISRPVYGNKLPKGNNGLGLLLLGITGDQVLPPKVYNKIKQHTLSVIRGTVQADILKEDQAQNTCVFSTDFALKLMGDVQAYFIEKQIKNFYSVSISGYHIAEAGANPVTQLALTLSNGFTYVEYYLSRGMKIDDFAPNLSFFFSNGMDPEYSVIGRVARRIWAQAIKYKYGGNDRSQKLKYHIQTSGRSLHAQEIAFNDIRTTLQALYAIYDNCNSLHTNAYDEAITTPTEESVRRAIAIQLIINKELGLAENENPLQGAFIIEELTNLVEEAVLIEFNKISEKGGVLGAMERMYQRTKIQEESLYYESQKMNGELSIVGVNTFLSNEGSPTVIPKEVIRSTEKEKQSQIKTLKAFQKSNEKESEKAIKELQEVALKSGNTFEIVMKCAKVCSLGQITNALYEVGGQYRRNM